MTKLAAGEVAWLDPDKFMAVLGKHVIHPGGRASTEALLAHAAITGTRGVLDVGCGVASTPVEIARRHGARVTAVDISPLMLERAQANVTAAGLGGRITVERGDILDLGFADGAFDVAEAVTMFVDRPQATAELARFCAPGGRVLATEFCWRQSPSNEVRDIIRRPGLPGHAVRHDRGLGADLRVGRAGRDPDRDRAVRHDYPPRVPGRRGPGAQRGHHGPRRQQAGDHPEDGLAHAPHGQGRPVLGYVLLSGEKAR
jgi:malonyl-CoA O-methyltransferase